MAFITPYVGRQFGTVYAVKMERKSEEKLTDSASSSRRSSVSTGRKDKESVDELRQKIAAAKPRSKTVAEGKSLDTLLREKDQRLAELKRRKQQNIRRRHTMVLRKISEQYENSQTVREDDLVFDQNANGFTTLERLNEVEEEQLREKEKEKEREKDKHSQAKKAPHKRISKFIRWICTFRP